MIYNYKYNCAFDLFNHRLSPKYYMEDDDNGVLGQFPPKHMVLPDK